jgi:hypothetical protein
VEKRAVSAESIARLADEKQDVSSFFANDGQMMPPLIGKIDPGEETIEEIGTLYSQTSTAMNADKRRQGLSR